MTKYKITLDDGTETYFAVVGGNETVDREYVTDKTDYDQPIQSVKQV